MLMKIADRHYIAAGIASGGRFCFRTVLPVFISLFMQSLIMPERCVAAFYIPPKAATASPPAAAAPDKTAGRKHSWRREQRSGHSKGVVGLVCSLLGCSATVGAIVAFVTPFNPTLFLLCSLGLSVLGIVFGAMSHKDRAGEKAMAIGALNLIGLWLSYGIYQASIANGDTGWLYWFIDIFGSLASGQ